MLTRGEATGFIVGGYEVGTPLNHSPVWESEDIVPQNYNLTLKYVHVSAFWQLSRAL